MTPDRAELDHLFSLTYEELRRLAAHVRSGDPSMTLNPTALVNEAYLKLAKSPRFEADSVLHFKRIAARAMRQVLVEAARHRTAAKRGSGEPLVTFDERLDASLQSSEAVLALDRAIVALSAMEPRQARVVELRYFAGLTLEQAADSLGVSRATASRHWTYAKAWLFDAISQE